MLRPQRPSLPTVGFIVSSLRSIVRKRAENAISTTTISISQIASTAP